MGKISKLWSMSTGGDTRPWMRPTVSVTKKLSSTLTPLSPTHLGSCWKMLAYSYSLSDVWQKIVEKYGTSYRRDSLTQISNSLHHISCESKLHKINCYILHWLQALACSRTTPIVCLQSPLIALLCPEKKSTPRRERSIQQKFNFNETRMNYSGRKDELPHN